MEADEHSRENNWQGYGEYLGMIQHRVSPFDPPNPRWAANNNLEGNKRGMGMMGLHLWELP